MYLKIQEAMSELLTDADDGLTNPVGTAFLAPGSQVAWDECCDDDNLGGTRHGGQLWVRIVQMRPSMPFPQVDNEQKCGVQLVAAVLGVGIVRCAHTLQDNGEPPTAAQMTGDTTKINTDAIDLFSVITEVFAERHRCVLGEWTPQGPDGGCAGGEWQLTIRLQPCTQ